MRNRIASLEQTGDLLQLSGRAEVAHDRTVDFEVDEARETRAGLPLRFALVEYSPANPPLSRPARPGISSAKPDVPGGRKR